VQAYAHPTVQVGVDANCPDVHEPPCCVCGSRTETTPGVGASDDEEVVAANVVEVAVDVVDVVDDVFVVEPIVVVAVVPDVDDADPMRGATVDVAAAARVDVVSAGGGKWVATTAAGADAPPM